MVEIGGAGLAGLLAANMLQHRDPVVHEKQASLPNNHSAVLRFRSSLVGDTLGIPFTRHKMIKDALPWKNPVADALAYSKKTTGIHRSDRSVTAGLVVQDRWIAPKDLIERMARRVNIVYDSDLLIGDQPVISTIPMPALMQLLNYPGYSDDLFSSARGYNVTATVLGCDAYVSIIVPDPDIPFYRASITGNELSIEFSGSIERHPAAAARHAASLLGIDKDAITEPHGHSAQYSKILPIDEEVRRDFIYWATDQKNVFSLGRFATWRPGLLLDDLVQDIRLIDRWLSRKNRYETARVR